MEWDKFEDKFCYHASILNMDMVELLLLDDKEYTSAIRKAFLQNSRIFHPDKGLTEESKFVQLVYDAKEYLLKLIDTENENGYEFEDFCELRTRTRNAQLVRQFSSSFVTQIDSWIDYFLPNDRNSIWNSKLRNCIYEVEHFTHSIDDTFLAEAYHFVKT